MIYLTVLFDGDPEPVGDPAVDRPTREEMDRFYSAMGMTLATWQFVEMELALMFSTATGARNYLGLNSAYGRVNNQNMKLDMLDDVMKRAGLSEELLAKWIALSKRSRAELPTRNRIAHGMVAFAPRRSSGQRLFITEPVNDPRKRQKGMEPEDVLGVADLLVVQNRWGQLRSDLLDYSGRYIFGVGQPPAADPELSAV